MRKTIQGFTLCCAGLFPYCTTFPEESLLVQEKERSHDFAEGLAYLSSHSTGLFVYFVNQFVGAFGYCVSLCDVRCQYRFQSVPFGSVCQLVFRIFNFCVVSGWYFS